MSRNEVSKTKKFSLPQIIFISLMATANVGFDLLVSPGFIALTTHIVAGLLIMVPINFLFIALTKNTVDKFGTITIYMIVFGAISSPLPFWGGTAGIFKLILGLIIGVLLDCVFHFKKIALKIVMGAILGSIIWWLPTFIIWKLWNLSIVEAMSNMLKAGTQQFSMGNGWIDLSGILELPITELNYELVKFAIICGVISSIPVFFACIIGYQMFLQIKKTSIYERFTNYQ
ncbi:hypothetical protein DSAG12_03335 [Promethearchaeum syntrophicum]|uniref:Uncharacterized protein n=1 Tax=Promethearchaeum syntrophicum TaxID=2594042 RepID=A0A5B9DE22_9ARCH|nr:hypothetical protein [Candidatus Prometheoarchaeum syntrophicum]QEE17498.1 hypothetical protein DSAG12_03335 [Candidatus Prometheoarchaeum syntrophicum]